MRSRIRTLKTRFQKKRTFYQILGIEPRADQAEIDAAYAMATSRMNTESLPGVKEDVNELYLIREGYQILSDPEKRAIYDAKLAGLKLALYPKDRESRHKLGMQTVILAVLTTIFGAIVYSRLNQKIEELRIENKQAITKQKGEQGPAAADAPRPDISDANAADKGTAAPVGGQSRPDTPEAVRSDAPDAAQPDAPDAKAGNTK